MVAMMLSKPSQMNPLRLRERTSSLDQPASADDHRARILFTSRCKPENPGNPLQHRVGGKSVRDPPLKLNHLLYNAVRDLNPSHGTSSRAATTGEAQQFRYRSTFSPSMVVVPGRVELGTIIKGKQHRRTRFTSLRVRHATECRAKGEQQTLSLDHLMCKSKIACLSFMG